MVCSPPIMPGAGTSNDPREASTPAFCNASSRAASETDDTAPALPVGAGRYGPGANAGSALQTVCGLPDVSDGRIRCIEVEPDIVIDALEIVAQGVLLIVYWRVEHWGCASIMLQAQGRVVWTDQP